LFLVGPDNADGYTRQSRAVSKLAFDLILRTRFHLFAASGGLEAGAAREAERLPSKLDAEPDGLTEAIQGGGPRRNAPSDQTTPGKLKQPSRWMLNRQQPVEERPVSAEGDAEVFRRHVVGLVPFRLQFLTLGSKDFRQPFDRAGH
jgi:hypothetical protein